MAGSVGGDRSSAVGRRAVALLLVTVGLVSSVLWLLRWFGPEQRNEGDAYWYARLSLTYSGWSSASASQHAAVLSCEWSKHRFPTTAQIVAIDCARSRPYQADSRYVAIFSNRVGYPALGAALRPLLGDRSLPAVSALCAVGACVVLSVIVLLMGGQRLTALLAGSMLLALPSGAWLAKVGTEAPTMLCVLAAAAAVTLLLIRVRVVLAGTLWVLAVISMFAIRPPTAIALAAACVVTAIIGAVVRRELSWLIAAGGALVVGLGLQLSLVLTHAPGLRTTIDDLATVHFTRTGVTDVWAVFGHMLWYTVGHYLWVLSMQTLFWTAVIVGACWWSAARFGRMSLPLLVLLPVGLAAILVHPIYTQVPRLASVAEPPVAVGIADLLAVALLSLRAARGRASPPAQAASPG